MSSAIGSGVFLEDVDKHEKFHCPICKTLCDEVKRNSSVKFIKSHCDIFYCPNRNKKWHKDVASLKSFIHSIPSKRLNLIIQRDISDLLSNNE